MALTRSCRVFLVAYWLFVPAVAAAQSKVYVVGGVAPPVIIELDPDRGTSETVTLANVPLDGPVGDPHHDRAYALIPVGFTTIPYLPCLRSYVYVLRATDLQQIASAMVLGSLENRTESSYCGFIALASAPTAPLNVTWHESNRTVTLTWSAPAIGAATGYLLEVGSRPGLADLAVVRLGPHTTITAPGVPSGTYYVRLRGVNVVGAGPASIEVRLVVP